MTTEPRSAQHSTSVSVRGFRFADVCDLFEELERNVLVKTTTTGHAHAHDLDSATIRRWFVRHRAKIFAGPPGSGSATNKYALLSCLLPARRPDRVLALGPAALARVVGRCLLLGASRLQLLGRYRTAGHGDLGQCVSDVLRQTEETERACSALTVEHVAEALDQLAARSRFSSPALQLGHADGVGETSAATVDKVLGPILRRVTACEDKWLVRLILNAPITTLVPEQAVLSSFHFLFPRVLAARGSLLKAVQLLDSDPLCTFPSAPESQSVRALHRLATPYLTPIVGCRVNRPIFVKARSLEHCVSIIGSSLVTVQRKYDGEYFQVHVNRTKPTGDGDWDITIFSKSGKDSTIDREGIHDLVRRSICTSRSGSPTLQNCILEGELLAWSDAEHRILPFHHIRKHVTRRGLHLGTAADSPPKPEEHLYIIFFDILLLNDRNCLALPFSERKQLLLQAVTTVPDATSVAEGCEIDFAAPNGMHQLRQAFARAISNRWEGLVIKRNDDLYHQSERLNGANRTTTWVKLKKDYIAGLGDTADFAIVGAYYDSRALPPPNKAVKNLNWTNFLIGCVDDIDHIAGANHHATAGEPIVVRVVSDLDHHNLPAEVLRELNVHGTFVADDPESHKQHLRLVYGQSSTRRADVHFRRPFVVDMYGAGFEKAANSRHWTLRFPRVTKIYTDRDWSSAITLSQLQSLAENAMVAPIDVESEVSHWLCKLGNGGDEEECDSSETTPSQTSSQEAITLLVPQRGPVSAELAVHAPTRSLPSCQSQKQQGPLTQPSMHSQSGNIQNVKTCENSHTILQSHDIHGMLAAGNIVPSPTIANDNDLAPSPSLFSDRTVFLGSSCLQHKTELQARLIRLPTITSSLPKFLDAVVTSESAPTMHADSDTTRALRVANCRGIMLIDVSKQCAGRAALDISHLGNALAARLRADRSHSEGFVMVLDWRIVDILPQLVVLKQVPPGLAGQAVEPAITTRAAGSDLATSLKRYYAGRLQWRHGSPRRLRDRYSTGSKRKWSAVTDEPEGAVIKSSTMQAHTEQKRHDIVYDTTCLDESVSRCTTS